MNNVTNAETRVLKEGVQTNGEREGGREGERERDNESMTEDATDRQRERVRKRWREGTGFSPLDTGTQPGRQTPGLISCPLRCTDADGGRRLVR